MTAHATSSAESQAATEQAEIERGLIGMLLVDPGSVLDHVDTRGREFADNAHQALFEIVQVMKREGDIPPGAPLAPAMLVTRLRTNAAGDVIALDKCGGVAYLAKLITDAPNVAHAKYYSLKLREAYLRRRGGDMATDLQSRLCNGEVVIDILYDASRQLAELATSEGRKVGISIGKLCEDNPRLAAPVIDGLIRRGEVGNIIAPPKSKKTWMTYGIALSAVVGESWLGQFACRKGRVLILDNELHASVIAARIPAVAEAMEIQESEYRDALNVEVLRGRLADIDSIAKQLGSVPAGHYDLIILDSFYRALPAGSNENDNNAITHVYNTIDAITGHLGCAWLNVHHSSKGAQGMKSITDVGAGAGSQSRAADAHIVLREHEEDGCVVLEAAIRSFPPVEPLPLRWTFPVWQPDDDVDPAKLKGRLTKGEQRQRERDEEGFEAIRTALMAHGPSSVTALSKATPLHRDRIQRLVNIMDANGDVEAVQANVKGNETTQYQLRAR